MSENESFVDSIVNRIGELTNSSKKPKSLVDLSKGSVCRVDGSAEELLRCLIENTKSHEGDMMVCVSESALTKSDAVLRNVARKYGVSLRVKRNIYVSGVKDAMCFKVSKEDKKRLIKGLS